MQSMDAFIRSTTIKTRTAEKKRKIIQTKNRSKGAKATRAKDKYFIFIFFSLSHPLTVANSKFAERRLRRRRRRREAIIETILIVNGCLCTRHSFRGGPFFIRAWTGHQMLPPGSRSCAAPGGRLFADKVHQAQQIKSAVALGDKLDFFL